MKGGKGVLTLGAEGASAKRLLENKRKIKDGEKVS
jgi:hypothetical protein